MTPSIPPLPPGPPPTLPTAARITPNRIEIKIRSEQLVREAKQMMLETIEDHKTDIATTDQRFSKKVKNALLGKNVSHHKLDLAVKATQAVWEGAKSVLGSLIPGLSLAGKAVEAIGAVGTAFFTKRAKAGQGVPSVAASLFNVNLQSEMLAKLTSIQNHGESIGLWGGVFQEHAARPVKSSSDLKEFYRSFKKLALHVQQCQTDFDEMNAIFQKFYLQGKNYVVTYRARKDETEARLAELFTSTLLNPMTHWQCIQDHKADPTVECFIDFDLDTFFGLFPLPLTGETMQLMRAELKHVPLPARKFFLDANLDGPLGILGGSFLSSAGMEALRANPTARKIPMSEGPTAMSRETWKAASKLSVSLRGGLNLRGAETGDIDTSVNLYGAAANTSIRKNLLQRLMDTPATAKNDAAAELRQRMTPLATVQANVEKYLVSKQSKTAERKVFIERLKHLVEFETAALRGAQFYLTKNA